MEARASSAESDPTIPLVDSTLKRSKEGPEVLSRTLPRGPRGLLPFAFYAHDPAGQLTQILHRKTPDNTALAWANYAYDPAGNRTSMTDYTGTHAYAYDDLHRLISAEHPSGSNVPTKSEVFDYDRTGNRLFDANITGYQYDAANRLLENSSFTYSYDGNGNQTGKTGKQGQGTTTYAYNAENQLVQADMPDGTRQTNAYDGLGRRIEKSTGSTASPSTVRYVYDNEDILAMLDGNNNLIALFTHGPGIDEPNIMKVPGGEEHFFHADALGSIVGLTNSSGALVERVEYEAYGRPRFIDLRGGTPVTGNQSFTRSPYAFTGREWDSASGLYFYRARYYDPRMGRFSSVDPLPLVVGIPDTSNRYTYASNSPYVFSDPFGLLNVLVGGGATGVVGIGGDFSGGIAVHPSLDPSKAKIGPFLSFPADGPAYGYNVSADFFFGLTSGDFDSLSHGTHNISWTLFGLSGTFMFSDEGLVGGTVGPGFQSLPPFVAGASIQPFTTNVAYGITVDSIWNSMMGATGCEVRRQ